MRELTETTRAGRMLAQGRLAATLTNPATGRHVSVFFKARKRVDKVDRRWERSNFAEATHVFITAGRGYNGDKVGTYYPATGKFFEDRNADPARVWAAKRVLHYCQTGELRDDLEISEADECGRCGRRLTDPVSIDRGIGPECFGKITGSTHASREQLSLTT